LTTALLEASKTVNKWANCGYTWKAGKQIRPYISSDVSTALNLVTQKITMDNAQELKEKKYVVMYNKWLKKAEGRKRGV